MGEAIPPALISSLTFNYFSKFRVSQAGHTPVMLSTASEFFPLAHQRPHCTQLLPPLTILPHQALLDIANVCEEVAHRCDLRDRGKKKRKKKRCQLQNWSTPGAQHLRNGSTYHHIPWDRKKAVHLSSRYLQYHTRILHYPQHTQRETEVVTTECGKVQQPAFKEQKNHTVL